MKTKNCIFHVCIKIKQVGFHEAFIYSSPHHAASAMNVRASLTLDLSRKAEKQRVSITIGKAFSLVYATSSWKNTLLFFLLVSLLGRKLFRAVMSDVHQICHFFQPSLVAWFGLLPPPTFFRVGSRRIPLSREISLIYHFGTHFHLGSASSFKALPLYIQDKTRCCCSLSVQLLKPTWSRVFSSQLPDFPWSDSQRWALGLRN